MKPLKKSDGFVDNTADTYVTSSMVVSDVNYCRLTFVRHILNPVGLPTDAETPIELDFSIEALQSVTLPTSVALQLAHAIIVTAQQQAEAQEGKE